MRAPSGRPETEGRVSRDRRGSGRKRSGRGSDRNFGRDGRGSDPGSTCEGSPRRLGTAALRRRGPGIRLSRGVRQDHRGHPWARPPYLK